VSAVPEALRTDYYFDLDELGFADLFADVSFVWEAIARLQDSDYVDALARIGCAGAFSPRGRSTGTPDAGVQVLGTAELRIAPGAIVGPYVVVSGDGGLVCIDAGAEVRPGTMIIAGKNAVYIGREAKVGPNAHLDAGRGSIVVGEKATLRQGAYLRELSVIGPKATIGNSCEVKCALIGPSAEVPHFNYVGDSIFGHRAHTGAGVKISNLKITPDPSKVDTVKVRYGEEVFDTGLRKFGVVLGDRAQLGCNSVANPGTLVGKNSLIYAGSSVGGFIPANTIVKLRQPFEHAELRTG